METLMIIQSLLFCAVLVRMLMVNMVRLVWRRKNRSDAQALAIDTLCAAFPEMDELKPDQELFIKTVSGMRIRVSGSRNN